MMLPNKDDSLIRVLHEMKKPMCFQRKEEHGMDNILDMGLGNYVFLEDNTNTKYTNQIYARSWKLFFDGVCVIIESSNFKVHPHAFKFQFECTIVKHNMKPLSED